MPEYLKLQKKLTNNWKKLGIGGYQETIQAILKRLLFPRALSPEMAKKLNVSPPNGALFYGPPGTGKTFIATVIGKHFFDKDHVDIINGPELFNPLVGKSEAQMRALFDKARRHPDETFVYVFDEIEALVAKRSSSDSVGATVGNRLTSTLLTVLDGAEKLNNILVIGVTNFKENLDDALIRSGRMGDHFEIGLPTYEDRLAILKVHIGPCIEAGTVTPQLDFEWLARETDGFSGADIAQLKRHAVGNMYESLFEFNPEGGVTYHEYEDLSAIQVGKEAFEEALLSVKPKARQEKIDFALKSELLLFKPKKELKRDEEASRAKPMKRVNSAHF
jgi:vesicle-fusing ATPase